MTSILSALLNGAVASVLVALVVWIVLAMTPRRILNAATRYSAWWLVLLAILLLPVAYLPVTPSGPRAVIVAASHPSGTADSVAQPSPRSAPAAVPANATPVVPRGPVLPVEFAPSWTSAVVGLWAAFSGVLLLRLIASCVFLSRQKSRAMAVPPEISVHVEGWLRQCGSSRRNLRLLHSSEVRVPMIAGLRSPAIIIPTTLLSELNEDELNQIGLHETAHLARWDDVMLIAQRLTEALFPWHPVIHWIAKRIDLEREIACDDFVVGATGSTKSYALCLTRVAELAGGGHASLLAGAAIRDRSHLTARISILLDRTRHTGTRLLRARLALFGVVVLVLSSIASRTPGLIAFGAPLATLVEHALAQPQPPAPTPTPAGPTPAPVQQQQPSRQALATPAPIPEPLVTLSVTVRDPMNRFVTGLTQDHFKVLDDGVEQEVVQFSDPDAALSAGIVIDTSGSMATKLRTAERTVARFLTTARGEDEYFLSTFGERTEVLHGFTSNVEEISSKLSFVRSVGRTPLFDGMHLAMRLLNSARNSRRALFLIVDDGDNGSRYSEAEIRTMIRDLAGVNVYAISLATSSPDTSSRGLEMVRDIAEQSGGEMMHINDASQTVEAGGKIGVELHNLYTVSFRPNAAQRDGKYHRLVVQVNTPMGLPTLRANHQPGYYAPKE